eukprot:TRINITY_DN63141_c0_g1_i1.p2 TRINITY_DN63141_c0_g1~~TRINITY_DN63141_c0_g1_i1.p2  ORF type:complete len:239 (-),score=30.78 TRINITY_DN63141_c0_g1_i1:98-814(-)
MSMAVDEFWKERVGREMNCLRLLHASAGEEGSRCGTPDNPFIGVAGTELSQRFLSTPRGSIFVRPQDLAMGVGWASTPATPRQSRSGSLGASWRPSSSRAGGTPTSFAQRLTTATPRNGYGSTASGDAGGPADPTAPLSSREPSLWFSRTPPTSRCSDRPEREHRHAGLPMDLSAAYADDCDGSRSRQSIRTRSSRASSGIARVAKAVRSRPRSAWNGIGTPDEYRKPPSVTSGAIGY